MLLNGCTTQTHSPCGQVKRIFQKTVDIFLVDCPVKSLRHQIKRMTGYIKEPHTAIFTGQTKCGKTYLVLELIEKEYNNHFDYIIIICQTLRENSTYHVKEWIKNDDDKVWLVEPKDNLYQWIKKLPELLRFFEVLFIIDDIIANESLDKKRQPLLELAIFGRHRGHYLWLLTVLLCYTN